MSEDRKGTRAYGREPGGYAVPFKSSVLPGVTAVAAVTVLGEIISGITDAEIAAAIRVKSREDRHANVNDVVYDLADGMLPKGVRRGIVITGDEGYDVARVANAYLDACDLIREHGKSVQADRYTHRVAEESDRILGLGRAGANPIGWSDASRVNTLAIDRASDAEIAAAYRAQAARSGENSPAAVAARRDREAAEAEAEAAEAEAAEAAEKAKRDAAAARKAERAAARKAKGTDTGASEAAEGAAETPAPRRRGRTVKPGVPSEADSPSPRVRRPRTGR